MADSGWVGEVVAWDEGQPETFIRLGCTHDGGQTRKGGVTVGAGCGVPYVRIGEGGSGTHHIYSVSYRKARVAGPPQQPGAVLHAVHLDCMVW